VRSLIQVNLSLKLIINIGRAGYIYNLPGFDGKGIGIWLCEVLFGGRSGYDGGGAVGIE
jgi:hypothetical protein